MRERPIIGHSALDMASTANRPRRSAFPGRMSFAAIAWIAWLVIAMAGCARSVGTATPPMPIFWPSPPDAKRIEFVSTLSRPQDANIHPSLFKQVMNYIGGRQTPAIVGPYGIAADTSGRLYVVDTSLRQIHVFDIHGNEYASFPKDDRLLASPVGIAIDSSDNIYVTDSREGVVHVFRDQGRKLVASFGKEKFTRPTGIAVNPVTGELLVVDTLQSRVFRYDLPGLNLKGFFNAETAGDSGFHAPTQIVAAGNGDIIVSDALNFRVLVFDAQGRFRLQIGRMGTVPGTFSRPKGVAVDSDDNIYVVDALFDNIQMFDASGRLLMAFGNHGSGSGEFWLPTAIAIDKNDLIYISDTSNHRVQIFRYLKEK